MPLTRRTLLSSALAVPASLSAASYQLGSQGQLARIRTAICAYSFRKYLSAGSMTYGDLVDVAVENGVDGLDLTVYWFPVEGRQKFLTDLRRKAYLNAVEIPSIAIRTDCCQKDAAGREREAAWIEYWVDVADRLGASHIRIFGGRVPKGEKEETAAGWVADVLTRAADHAGRKGVVLGLENHGGITLKADRIIDIVNRVDHPFVGINLDTGNFREDHYAQMAKCLPYAANSQYKVNLRFADDHHEPCDWDRITKMFGDAGYRGYIALEYEDKEDPKTAVPRHLATMNALAHKYSA